MKTVVEQPYLVRILLIISFAIFVLVPPISANTVI